jgi:hypothetical protein
MARSFALFAPLCACLLSACSQPKTEAPAHREATKADAPPKVDAPPKAETKKTPVVAPAGDCTPVLNTLITRQPEAKLTLTVADEVRPVEFKADAVYPANPLWDASKAPSLCAAVLQPPEVERPALNLVGQFEAEGKPVMRIQATGIEMGERDLTTAGTGALTGMLADGAEAKTMNFSAGKLVLERVEGAKSRVTMRLEGAAGTLTPGDSPFVLQGTITATVGGR